MAEANDSIANDRRIALRVGINLGDVVVDGGDLYGEGVIIAVRLQGMASAGGICISGGVHDQIVNKLPLTFEDLGPCEVKNISKPVKALRVRIDRQEPERSAAIQPSEAKPSIAVLPFTNMSGDPEQEYFSDGITEDIITELSRFRSLFVIARNSSFAYKGKSVKVQEIARELNVAYVVEGSVRKLAPRIRITVQLIDAATGNHLWAERYDQAMEDIFAIQDDVVAKIVARVAGQVAAAGTARARRKPTDSLAAYDCLLRSMEEMNRYSADHIKSARDVAEQAIAIDPNFAQAHSVLALSLLYLYWLEAYSPQLPAERLDRALEAATRAVALEGNDASCHRALALIYLARKSFDLAKHHFDVAVQLNSNDVKLVANRGMFEVFAGHPEAALELLDQAQKLDPQLPIWYWEVRGMALYQLWQYANAAAAFERMKPAPIYIDRFCAACYAQLGRANEAQAKAAAALRRDPRFTLRRYAMIDPYQSRAALDHLIEGMRKAGLPE